MSPELRREQLLDAALGVILEQGYSGVSIEAVARTAGVTRPVVYDHFPNLGRLLYALVEREERTRCSSSNRSSRDDPGELDPPSCSPAASRFLDAVTSRPATWRIILLPPPARPRSCASTSRRTGPRRWADRANGAMGGSGRPELPAELDVELTARAIRDLGEEAGRMVLTDPERYPPERYEQFVGP